MSTTGAPLNLTLPASGTKNWDTLVNPNFSAINTAIAALQAGGTTGPAGPTGPTGPVGMVFAGPYGSGTPYVINNVVTFNGGSYIAIANSTNRQPDINTGSWAPLALPGAAGPAGPTGPAGTGSGVTFPISIAEGGTGAITAALARAALGAAASGVNSDITNILALVPPPGLSNSSGGTNTPAIQITSVGDAQGLLLTDGTFSGGFTTSGAGYLASLNMSGGLLCGPGQFAGGVTTNQVAPASGGTPLTLAGNVVIGSALTVQGATPVVAAGYLGIGSTTATTATAGGGQATPGTVLGYFIFNDGGTNVKVAFYSV